VKNLIVLSSLTLTLVACGLTQPGPNGEPAPLVEGVGTVVEAFDPAVWTVTFGPWGYVVAGVLAVGLGVKKTIQVWNKRKNP
jgi:hypothetical protein